MPIHSLLKKDQYTYIFLLILSLSVVSSVYASEQVSKRGDRISRSSYADISDSARDNSSREEGKLTELQKQARNYRSKAWEQQCIGNVEVATSLYQKAIQLDPLYAVAYNDLGVIYESKGSLDRSEGYYLKAIKVDPNYLSAYSNLALFYENKRDLKRAAFYWKKRASLGPPDDPWTQKAKQRLKDIRMVNQPGSHITSERDVLSMMTDVSHQRTVLKRDNRAMSRKLFEEAKQSYEKDDYDTAIKKASDAQQLDRGNKDIQDFLDKVELRGFIDK